MNEFFKNQIGNYVLVYLDDVVVYSENENQHWSHVKEVLEILQANNLFCAEEKCHFGKRSINYLGYVISAAGIRMDPKKVSAIMDWPLPTNLKDLQVFLGFTNFYRRLIKDYASITAPLTKLLQKDASFTDFPIPAFESLKSAFCHPTFLPHPNEKKPFVVETDASDYAIGGILSQYNDENELCPVAFYSRQMISAEKNYEIYDKELLAVFACFTEWRHYLQGGLYQVTVLSDHKNLQYFMTTKQLTRRQARWSLFFNEFDFLLTHRPGHLCGKPDNLSRRPDYFSKATYEPENFIQLLKPNQVSQPENSTNSNLASVTTFDILHQRLGHINNLKLLKSLKVTTGLSLSGKVPETLCEACELGKANRRDIPRVVSTEHELLEVIEMDSQGPFPVIAHNGSSSNIKFIDNKSAYVKMETLPDRKAKTALDAFISFKTRLELRTGKKIKIVRTDQGTEFNGDFAKYLESNGIIKQKGLSYYHTHPGKAERVHQSILQQGRCMLISSNLPPMFYADAQLTAAYLHNRTVHASDSKTPYEHIYGRKPEISHLRPFGCVAYARIPSELRSKLQPAAEKCRILGYLDDDDSVEMKGYKLLRESDLAIIHSRDVRFDEKITMDRLLPRTLYDDDLFNHEPSYTSGTDLDADVLPIPSPKKHYQQSLVTAENILSETRRRKLVIS